MFLDNLLNKPTNDNESPKKRDWGPMALRPYLNPFMAISLSLGYAIGWNSFVMPGTAFLPIAGPMGTILGIAAGAAVLIFIAWCYHTIAKKVPGPGGSFIFTNKVLGNDHAFLMSWFLSLTYIAILWANATAVVILARLVLNDALQFGFLYELWGFKVYAGEVLLSMLMILTAGLLCMRSKRLAAIVQTLLVAVVVTLVLLCLIGIMRHHTGGLTTMRPAFPRGESRLMQFLHIFALAPLIFIGFEAISNSSGEFSFPVRQTFSIFTIVLITAVIIYISLAMMPVLAYPAGYNSWLEYIKDVPNLNGIDGMPIFAAVYNVMGKPGLIMMAIAMFAGQFTGLIATFIATSRLIFAMAKTGIVPRRFGLLDNDASPRNAILLIMFGSLIVPFFGYSLVSQSVEITSIGAIIAYGYTSAASYKMGHKTAGTIGILFSVIFSLLILLPNHLTNSFMSAESYILLALWSLLGCISYRIMFKHDTTRQVGQSVVVSMALIILIIFSCLMWIIQSFNEQADRLLNNVNNTPNGVQYLEYEIEILKNALVKGCVVEMIIFVVALSIVLSLYSILRKREQQLAIEKSKMEDMNKAKSYFFSTVSHDIRTPLNAIIGFSQMLKTGFETEEERKTALDSILVCSKTLLNLINDVLDISKLEAGRMEIKPEPTVCSKLVQEIVESFKISNKNDKVEIRSRIDDMPTLMLDAQRLRQITFNLIGNAMKFTKEGHVEIRTAFKKGTFRLQVEDTGQGISKEDLARIASPYVQLGTKTSRNGGTGLGLTISRQLAIAMGGKLEVQSTLGKGSTFSITLYDVEVSNEEPQNKTTTISKLKIKHKCHRLLLVDDQKTNLLVLKAMLKKLGDFEISMAFNGVEAFEALKKQEGEAFDMVLTDMWMPEMNGDELIKLIRADLAFKDLPVYVITADVEAMKTYSGHGFTGILLKPITLEGLKELLE